MSDHDRFLVRKADQIAPRSACCPHYWYDGWIVRAADGNALGLVFDTPCPHCNAMGFNKHPHESTTAWRQRLRAATAAKAPKPTARGEEMS